MSTLVEVRIPKYPDCWETCGSCGSGDVFVQSVLVSAGDRVGIDDTIIVLETGKIGLDIPSPKAGRVVEVMVRENDPAGEGDLILILETG
jgi:pyruvate/2-oxoglutarate dehydrogenase complex dihydrolipoamide acyltransferase (E2) component